MVGDDRKFDVRGGIANLIALRIRELLETSLNEYQDPAWVQATELFVEIVVPCEAYSSEALHDLGVDIVNEAKKRGSQAKYQAIPGIYNRKTMSGSISAGSDTEVVDYSKKIESVKSWVNNYEKWFK
ncbi:hypothetical protein ES708_31423 [subsurface metagenome]